MKVSKDSVRSENEVQETDTFTYLLIYVIFLLYQYIFSSPNSDKIISTSFVCLHQLCAGIC